MKHFPKNSVKIFIRLLLSIVISISVTIIVLTPILYLNFEKISVSFITSSMRESLEHISYSATFMNTSAQNMMKQLFVDSSVQYLLTNQEPSYPQLSACLNQLSAYKSSSNFVESIYVYNPNTDTVYSTRNYGTSPRGGFADQDIFPLMEHSDIYNMQHPVFRVISAEGTQAKSESVFTYILSTSHSRNGEAANAVVLNVSASWMQDIILSMQRTSFHGTTLLFDGPDSALDLSSLQLSTPNAQNAYVEQIFHSTQPSGSFTMPVDGTLSLVTYVFSDSSDWVFARIIPYSAVTGQVDQMRTFTFLFSGGILLAGLLIAFVLSRRLYLPLHSMDRRMQKLELENWNQGHIVRQERYRKMLLGENPSGVSAQNENLLSPGAPVRILLFRFDRFKTLRHLPGAERSLYGYALLNMACELFSCSAFSAEGVPMGDEQAALLLSGPNLSGEHITGVLSQLLQNIEQHFSVTFSVSVSSPGEYPDSLSLLYAQCRSAIDYRLFYGHGSVLFFEDVCRPLQTPCAYPVTEENLLIEQLVQGKAEEAKATYRKMMEQMRSNSFRSFRLMILKLLTTLYIARDGLELSLEGMEENPFSELVPLVDSWETMDDIDEYIFSFFNEITQLCFAKNQMRKTEKYGETIEAIKQEIGQKYADPGLSLYSLDALNGMNPAYFGRIFRQTEGCSVSDYLNRVRLEQAKLLLRTTDAPVAEVAVQVGFSSSNYFYSIFKKNTGITPAVYRQCGGLTGNAGH